jgi:hypothetical protein
MENIFTVLKKAKKEGSLGNSIKKPQHLLGFVTWLIQTSKPLEP